MHHLQTSAESSKFFGAGRASKAVLALLPSTTLPLTCEQPNKQTAADSLQLPTALRFFPLKDKPVQNVHVIRLLH